MITEDTVTDGTIKDGAVTLIDPIRYCAVTNDGAAKVFATFGGVSNGLGPELNGPLSRHREGVPEPLGSQEARDIDVAT